MIIIELTPHNLFTAGLVGISRHVKGAWKLGQYGANNAKNGWQINCDGASGELAVAKWLGVFYDGSIGNFRAKDAGLLQVRTNPNDWGDLMLHPKDEDRDMFVLVLSNEAPTFTLRGWLYGSEGKLEQWWRDGEKGRPAFFVPQSALRPMETIREKMSLGESATAQNAGAFSVGTAETIASRVRRADTRRIG